MTDAADRRTCLHEAAHAVADVILGGTVEYVSARPGRTFSGIEVSAPRSLDATGFDGLRSVSIEPAALRAGIERRIIVTLAGDMAALYLGQAGYLGEPTHDEEIARQALKNLGPRLFELLVAREASTDPRQSDEEHARAMANAFAGHDAGYHYVEWLRCEARQLVIRYASAIVRVADALERCHVLTGEQVAALV